MNWDNLKEAGNNDTRADEALSATGDSIRKSVPVIGRVRKNIKQEFVVLCGIYILLLLITFLSVKTIFSTLVASTIAFFLLLQTGYYIFRFYRFYKLTGRADVNTRKNIRQVIYALEVAIEQYKSYIFFTLPLAGSLLFILFEHQQIAAYFHNLITTNTGS